MDKVLYINSAFTTKEAPTDSGTESIFIQGYASTTDKDRMGDVIPSNVWESGIKNYLKNPIILFQHKYDHPVGKMVEHSIDNAGLWIKARISAAAETYALIKDEVISAFSVGFRILDAEYNSAADIFVIKEVELLEISIVSIPANQNTLFSLSKAFDTAEEYEKFKKQFAPKGESAKGLESSKEAKSESQKEWNMDPKELQTMLATAAAEAAEKATSNLLAAQKADAEAKAVKAAEEEALAAKIEAAVQAKIKTVDTGAERLLAEITKRIQEQEDGAKETLSALSATIAEKTEELKRLQESKMQFTDNSNAENKSTYAEREQAVLLAKIMGKSVDSTKYGQQIVQKAGAHVPSATWELEVSLNMESEVRRRLVVSPIFRNIQMQTNVMTIPVNPEAGYATWVTNAQFGTDDSSGAAQTHALTDITLNAYKLATREYVAYEEEEDSLIVLLPIIRDAMIRRTAKAVDKAFLRGAGAGADPVKGLVPYDVSSAVTVSTATAVTVANLRALRKDMGSWGLTPSEMVYIVSTDVYYDLLEDANFQTMDKVGSSATLLTGQIGAIGNTPVIVSAEFDTKGAGAASVVAVNPMNFIVGNQRGLRFETDNLVETQRKVLVASLRTGMTQVTTSEGQGLSVLRWS